MKQQRDNTVDFFRGIAILDMILVHFSGFMPPLISKIVDYTDFAMEGFVLVAGYMVGRKYYHDFASRWKQVVWKLYSRALQLYAIHAVMVLTINVPLFYLLYDERRTGQFGAFLLNSLLLLNQIGLMHILPAFIPLYLVSPLILYFSRRHGTWVLIFSFALFGIGNFHPYLLDLGEKTIFPFILWQVYFVAGCFMGIRSLDPGKGKAVHPNTRFSLAALFMAIMMILKHFKIIDPSMISKFPLNFPGLLYGVSIPAFLYTFILRAWKRIQRHGILLAPVSALGRNSLLVFVIHVYTAKFIVVMDRFFSSRALDLFLILSSLILIFSIVRMQNEKNRDLLQSLRSFFIKVRQLIPANS